MNQCPACSKPYGKRKRCYSCESIAKWEPKPWLDASGYLRMRLPNSRKKVYYHRWLVEQHIGRPILWPEVVHHINHDKTDNRIENLELTTASEHTRSHCKGIKTAEKGWSNERSECIVCSSDTIKHHAKGLCMKCYSKKHEKTRFRCRAH